MARGQVTPAVTAPALPKPSFTKIEDEPGFPAFSDQIRSFGYHNPTDFELPSQYIRHIEPLEIDLERQVEYDMDEQDQEWLDAVNAERTKAGNGSVSYEIFEVIIDRLEKEWFNLNKHIPKPDLALPSEDSTCAICDDSEGENSNAIVFCDGCNLAVHQDCYGVPYIPEGQWLCRKCTVSPENPVSCILCPNEGGAFKQTSQGEWIHLLCAIWIPETRVSNDVFMEPIIGVEKITKGRWKLKCTICLNREGACIQCANKSCFLAFHVTCARKDRLLLPMKSAQGSEPGALTCYCDRHLPKEQAEIREAAMKAEEEEGEDLECKSAQLSKSARAYAKTYKPGPPLVPAIILGRIVQYISRVLIHKKPDFVALVCRYWSLKREARRGAPLLKRLHLEPWTASSSTKTQGEEEKVMKLEQLRRLRKDLEDLEHLTELSRQREARKLHQAEVIHEVLSKAIFPAVPELRKAFKAITTVDRNEYFKNPVSKKDVPDYFDIVKRPMFWSKIEENLDNYQYWDIQSFKDDIQLVLDNAVLYNKQGTTFHKAALRIQASAQPILAGLDQLSSSPNLRLAEQADGTTLPWTVAPVGDLEPSLEILELLFSSDALKDESEHILSADPLTSLFNFELGKKRPTPPPPTPLSKPVTARTEKKRQEKPLQKQQTRAARAARGSSVQDSFKEQTASAPPEPRAPRTRNAVAAAVAFEAEPGSSSVSAPPRRSRASKASAPVSEAPSPQPRRPSAPIPSLGEIPLVESVDDRDSFTMFDQGWILPQGQRRGGRVAQERSAAPPPKKKQRVGDARGTSRLSTFSTAASENQTLHPGSPYGDGIGGASSSMDNSIEIDPERVVIPPPNVIRTPDGKVIIEELDTPSIRKEKRRLEMEKRAAAAADAASLSMEGSLSPLPDSPDTNQDEDADDEDADMTSDLSEVESDVGPAKGEHAQVPPPGEQAEGPTDAAETSAPAVQASDAEERDSWVQSDAEPVEGDHVEVQPPGERAETEKDPEGKESVVPRGEMEYEEEEEMEAAPLVASSISDTPTTAAPAPAVEESIPAVEVPAGPDEPTPEPASVPPAEATSTPVPKTEADRAESVDFVEPKPNEPEGVRDFEKEKEEMDVPEIEMTVAGPETQQEADATANEPAPASSNAAMEDVETKPEAAETTPPLASSPSESLDHLLQPSDEEIPDDLLEDVQAPDADPEETAPVDMPKDEEANDQSHSEAASESPDPDVLTVPQGGLEGEEDAPGGNDEAEETHHELAGEQDSPSAPLRATQPVKRSTRLNKDLGRLAPPSGHKRVEPGTLVWAKAVSYPWWPAVIFGDNDNMIPIKVLAEAQSQRKRQKGKDWLYIVRFFDKNKSWQYLPLEKMRELGESPELDQDMLSKNSKRQNWKNKSSAHTDCQIAYKEAMEEMESGDEKAKFVRKAGIVLEIL